jgi:SAM-dependent methyltransferase
MTYWNELERHPRPEDFWMGHPLVRTWINEHVSGSGVASPLDWFATRFGSRIRDAEVLSIGCGTGGLERDLTGRFPAARILGIDTSERAIGRARDLAGRANLSGVTYQVADAWTVLRTAGAWDTIFFHAALHHFDQLPELLRLAAGALKADGLLYLDEYVGPSMREWNLFRLGLLNAAYRLLPRKARRVGIIRTPRNPDDPTEAICSSQIVPAVLSSFEVVERRDYGGNLVSVIFPNLQQGSSEAIDDAVARMLTMERFLLEKIRLKSFHTVLVARPIRQRAPTESTALS